MTPLGKRNNKVFCCPFPTDHNFGRSQVCFFFKFKIVMTILLFHSGKTCIEDLRYDLLINANSCFVEDEQYPAGKEEWFDPRGVLR